MQRFLLSVSLLAVLVFAAGCVRENEANSDLDFDSNIMRTDVFTWSSPSFAHFEYPHLIASLDALLEYLDVYGHHVLGWASANGFLVMQNLGNELFTSDMLREEFFENNVIVMLRFEEGSGSIRHSVERIASDGRIFVNRYLPEMGTADMAGWHIRITLDKSTMPEVFSLHLNNISN